MNTEKRSSNDRVEDHSRSIGTSFEALYDIVRVLRGPQGCAWDRQQTPATLRANLIEESYEAINAIDTNDDDNLREELGDLFLILTMIARLKEEEESFSISEVFDEICAKLVRRHPHVFGDEKKEDVSEIVRQWERIKREVEGKEPKDSVLEDVPGTLPPLDRACYIQKKAGKVGFDWQNLQPVWDKLSEEIGEIEAAFRSKDGNEIESEFGDLLFTVVNLCRLSHIDPAIALNRTNQKFIRRFQEMERRIGRERKKLEEMSLEEMDLVWNRIKSEEKGG